MTATVQFQQELLLMAAVRSDMFSIMHVVNSLSEEQKEAMSGHVFNEVLGGIARCVEANPVYYSTLPAYVRAVGHRLPVDSIGSALQMMPHQMINCDKQVFNLNS
jgi:hypothetical protein